MKTLPTAWRRLAAAGLLAAALLGAASSACAEPVAASEPGARPRVALVLSGGGARGFAHIGVLRALRELHVPVDIVVGTSMGAVIGGAYASGRSLEDLERIVSTTDWDRVLADRPPRDELAYRRREEDLLLPSRIEFGVSWRGLSLPPATAGNAALELALSRLLGERAHDLPSNALPVMFRSVASDLLTGELVELKETPLFQALRASLSLPRVFAPVRTEGRLLVDGGLVRNLPVDLARSMGADVVIAVNVGTPLSPEAEMSSSIGVAQQMLNILTEQNVQRSLRELEPRDILISPELGRLSFLDFGSYEQSIRAGEEATQRAASRLQALALPPTDYAALETKRLGGVDSGAPAALPLARLEVQGARHVDAQALARQTELQQGRPVTVDEVRDAAARLYGRGDLQSVEATVTDDDGQRSVQMKVTEADWARNRLRLGLELASDFSDNNTFSLAAMYVASSLNAWGAELRATGRVGSRRSLELEWWQPLGAGSPWYVAPVLTYEAAPDDLFDKGLRVARYEFEGRQLSLGVGRQLSNWGDVRMGLTRVVGTARLIVPEDTEQRPAAATQWFVRAVADTLDSLSFPTRGALVEANFMGPVRRRDPGAEQAQVIALGAASKGLWAGHVYGEWAHATSGNAPSALGGFLRLSGTQPNSVQGSTVALGRIVLARRIGMLATPFGGAVRAGASLELGGAVGPGEIFRFSTLKQSSSAFLSADTRFGPLYLATGTTQTGASTFYVFLGPIW
jgi:NTE family protein